MTERMYPSRSVAIARGVLLDDVRGPNATVTRSRRRGLTASSQVIDLGDAKEARRQKTLHEKWQDHVWAFYHTLGIVHFAHEYIANCLSRVRLYPAYRERPSDPPVPLDNIDDPEFELPDGADPATAAATVELVAQLDERSEGGLAGLMSDFGLNLGLVGEGYLHEYEDEKSGDRKFTVRSVCEIKSSGDEYYIYTPGSTLGTHLTKDKNFVARIWRSDRQWRDLADAPMRALLDDCDNLLALKRVLLASSYSRQHGGVLKVPNGLIFANPRSATDPTQQARDIPVLEAIEQAITTAIQDPASINSVAPVQVTGPLDELGGLEWLDLGRGYGDELLKQIKQVEETIALGLDLPNEVITGLGDVNHWGAWQVDEQTFKAHIEPLLLTVVRGLVEDYLWHRLRAQGFTENLGRYLLGHDPSNLIGHPNQEQSAAQAHERLALSDEAYLRHLGFSEDDLPDEEEIAQRLWVIQQTKVAALPGEIKAPDDMGDLTQSTPQPAAPPAAGSQQPPEQPMGEVPPKPGERGAPMPAKAGEPQMPGIAAAAGRPGRTLGARLAEIDRDLLARIHVLSDQSLDRALQMAGAQLKRAAGSRDRKLAASLRGVPVVEIGRKIGRESVEAWGLKENELIDKQLGDLQTQYERNVKRALGAALLAGRGYARVNAREDVFPDGEVAERQKQADPHIAAGFALLSGAVVALAHDRLFAEAPGPPPVGEIDLSAQVPVGTIRESLAIAGGAQGATATGQAPGGVALGPLVMGALRDELAIFPASFQWVYGYPDREFPPHADLEGVEFSSWEDEVLVNNDSFPASPWYRPGDHAGCLCTYLPVFASDRPIDDTALIEEEV